MLSRSSLRCEASEKRNPITLPGLRFQPQWTQAARRHRRPDRLEFRQSLLFAILTFLVIVITYILGPSHGVQLPLSVKFIMGAFMQDSMTFRALTSQSHCQLCSVSPAVLEFDILTDQEHSRQHGLCCARCACNVLQALAGVHPQSAKEEIPKNN